MPHPCRFRSCAIYPLHRVVTLALLLSLAACGGGGGGSTSTTTSTTGDTTTGDTTTGDTTSGYTISGRIVGLATNASVVLQNNSGDNLTVNTNGPFTFATGLSSASSYEVSVLTQPANGQICSVTNNSGSGTAYSDIDTVRVTCASVFTYSGFSSGGYADGTGVEAAFDNPSGMAIDASNNLYVADVYNHTIRKIAPGGVVTTLAGAGISGYVDATGTAARFQLDIVSENFIGVAVDTSGNVYVADTGNQAIRKITPGGVVTTLAGGNGAGYQDGAGSVAQFSAPQGLGVDALGNVYVVDTGNRRIRKITPDGTVSTFAGSGDWGTTDGVGTAASFHYPKGLAVDANGNLYVAEYSYNKIRKITPDAVVSTFAGSSSSGKKDATGTDATFNNPYGMAVDTAGNVYVADQGNSLVRVITPAGVVSTLAGGVNSLSFADGPAVDAQFYNLIGIAVDTDGNVYLGDMGNDRIRKVAAAPYTYTVGGFMVGLGSGSNLTLQNAGIDSLTVTADGLFHFGTSLTTATGYSVSVATPPSGQSCSVTNGSGSFTSGDVWNIGVNCAAVSTLAGSGSSGYVDGAGVTAQFRLNSALTTDKNGVAVDGSGNVYVADTFNHVIRKITPGGDVSTLAGSGVAGLADGTGAAAQFNRPRGVTVDGSGNLYVADTANNCIRKITPAGVVTTIFGSTTGLSGDVDANGVNARFYLPSDVELDSAGNLYVADEGNVKIRKITQVGDVTTLAGNYYGYTNGTGTGASFSEPYAVTVDAAGNVYVADAGNNAIRKVTPAGVVTTFAGIHAPYSNSGFADGPGTVARFRAPTGIDIDSSGTLYVADYNNNAIRIISPSGMVTTLAGTATTGDYIEGNGVDARFNSPGGVAVDGAGSVYVVDSGNDVVRKIEE